MTSAQLTGYLFLKIVDFCSFYEELDKIVTIAQNQRDKLKKLLPPDPLNHYRQDLPSERHKHMIRGAVVNDFSNLREGRHTRRGLMWLFKSKIIKLNIGGLRPPNAGPKAAFEFLYHKMIKDPHYGDVIHGYSLPLPTDNNNKSESLQTIKEESEDQETMPYVDSVPTKYFTNMFSHTTKQSKKCALVTTPLGFQEYERLLPSGGENIFNVHVEPGHKQLSNKVAQVAIDVDFTIAHLKMDARLSQCDAENRLHQLQKLDKRLHRIYESAAPKAFIVLLFTGSPLTEEPTQCSNGAAMMCVKGIERFRYNGVT
ncbi:unnamed protein product, partial [Meganyctiphanes norvegica]